MTSKVEKDASSFWRFGLAAGLAISAAVTIIIVTWEWLENPSGIFHDQNGTNWGFMWDTAISWFVPTFFVTAGVAAAFQLARSAIRRARDTL